ncbi:hypothetical protein BESB_023270 [Besnoitia besnoiti]|uniref:Uncharacterized protein n=1 Tax=Besnoitia besnoiti TaxID=94643 RepID=A0A2A9M1H1_BESBE|nr:hypothetical protein BESB_023270 [Besnoitia besnoiti]PFH31835.1 hypothetical protein BESB_023270 [Besnoitia besnoiti]
MAAETEDYLGAHRRHAFYVTPESTSAEQWGSVFESIRGDDFEGFVKSLELAAPGNGCVEQSSPNEQHEDDKPQPPRPVEVEISGCHSIIAHAAAFSEKCLIYLVETLGCDVNLRSSG